MASLFAIEAFSMLGLGVMLVVIRMYARWSFVGSRKLAFDDYLMMVAMLVYGAETAAAYGAVALYHGLANNGMTDAARITIDPSSIEWRMRVEGSRTQLLGWSFYTLLLWILKLCMNNFYARLTERIDGMRTRIRIGFGVIGVTYIATILSILLGCRPLYKNWQIRPDPGSVFAFETSLGTQLNFVTDFCQPAISKINVYVTVVLNVTTDIYLMSIPLPMLWHSKIATGRKAFLLVMFSGGVFIIMSGILRCVLNLFDPVNGAQEGGKWACRETFVAVVVGNVPMIYPLIRRAYCNFSNWSIISVLGQSKSSRSQYNSRNPRLNSADLSTPLCALPKRVRTRARHPLSIPTFLANDSIERLTDERPRSCVPKDNCEGDKMDHGISVTRETAVDIEQLESQRDEGAYSWYAQYAQHGFASPSGPNYEFHVETGQS